MSSVVPSVVGIDPGNKGALAYVGETGLQARRMPVSRRKLASGRTKTLLDAPALCRCLQGWNPTLVVIEDVYSSPQMGVVGAFTFGEGKGTLAGVCAGLGLPVLWVHPSVWKRAMKVTADKASSKALAARLFPGVKIKSADEAEAALLAMYGLIYSKGKLVATAHTELASTGEEVCDTEVAICG
jgi:crossover junction endodeoxyribonuclease RuvC